MSRSFRIARTVGPSVAHDARRRRGRASCAPCLDQRGSGAQVSGPFVIQLDSAIVVMSCRADEAGRDAVEKAAAGCADALRHQHLEQHLREWFSSSPAWWRLPSRARCRSRATVRVRRRNCAVRESSEQLAPFAHVISMRPERIRPQVRDGACRSHRPRRRPRPFADRPWARGGLAFVRRQHGRKACVCARWRPISVVMKPSGGKKRRTLKGRVCAGSWPEPTVVAGSGSIVVSVIRGMPLAPRGIRTLSTSPLDVLRGAAVSLLKRR